MPGKGSGGATWLYEGFKPNAQVNRKNLLYHMYKRVLVEIAVNRFKWEGLPDTVDARFIELELYRRGVVVFYYDEQFSRYLALQGTPRDQPNVYYNPTSFQVYGNAHLSKVVYTGTHTYQHSNGELVTVAPNAVPIWPNALRIPDQDIVEIYASKLAEIDQTIEISALQQRHPYIVATDQAARLSAANIMRQVQEGQPIIQGTESMAGFIRDNITVLNTGVDANTPGKMQDVKHDIWNEAMTLLGVNNSNQDKRERLVASEVEANNEQVLAMRYAALEARLTACEQIKKLFGLDVSVNWTQEEKDGQNARLYDGTTGISALGNSSEIE